MKGCRHPPRHDCDKNTQKVYLLCMVAHATAFPVGANTSTSTHSHVAGVKRKEHENLFGFESFSIESNITEVIQGGKTSQE